MKGFLFRARRSSVLKGIVLVTFSFLCSVLLAAAVIARIMFYFGMEYEQVAGLGTFSDWLDWEGISYSGGWSFFMSLRPVLIEIVNSWQFYVWILAAVGLILFFMFLYLMASAGYHGMKERPCLRGLEKVPYDLLLLCFLLLCMFIYAALNDCVRFANLISVRVTGGILISMAGILCILVFLQITAAQMRTGTLLSGALVSRVLYTMLVCIRKIPFIWKAAAVWGGCLGLLYLSVIWLHGIWAYYMDDAFLLIWTVLICMIFFVGIWMILQMNLVRKKAHQLAEGDLEQEKDGLEKEKKRWELAVLPVFRNCLQDLDCISDGMNVIVEEKMKSERFQTELITNVSHDIKTPLTSIINYLDFLSQEEKKENRNPQVVQEYMEVLDRQSVRLKKLIEDLIEASKASTGSLNIRMEPCELGIFLQQLAGEYEERLEQSSLKLNLVLPDEKIYVKADGRYLWRVLDNLLQNVCKYAMAGTRVYLQLQEKAGQAIIVIKNISASELNIPAEELMERFVRGDRSRHTEGSGLGLSIAKSLTELQGGKFAIDIDGDLFKTAVGFPVIVPPRLQETEAMENAVETADTAETSGASEIRNPTAKSAGNPLNLLKNEV